MKIGQTAKAIDTILKPNGRYNHNQPQYIGMCTNWNDKRGKWETVNSTFVARKYSQIIELVEQTKANVFIEGDTLHITYATGAARIAIDEIVKTVLIPELKAINAMC